MEAVRAFTTRADSSRSPAANDWRTGRARALESLTPAGALLQHNAPCACGGGCPRCAGSEALPAIQAKLHVGAPGDAHEHEADRVAEHVAGASVPHERATTHPHDAPHRHQAPHAHDAPPVVHHALQGASEPLDTTTRALMESRLGHDFGDVRVNAGELAGRSARALGALAYTSGRSIVFGEGQYAPGTSEGRRLIAHELTHVVQQSAPGAHGGLVRRDTPKKTTAAPAKFYQPIADEIAKQEADHARQRKEKQHEFMVHKDMNYEPLKALLPLAQAVDEGRTADIPALVDAFIKIDKGPPFAALSREMLVEIVSRLFTLGLDAESQKLRDNFSKGEKSWDWLKRDVGLTSRSISILDAIVSRTAAAADNSTAPKTKATVEQLVKVIPPLRDEMLSVDQEEVRRTPSYSMGLRPAPIAEKERWDGLVAVMNKLVTAISASLQSLVERAADELGTGKAADGKATLLLIRELVETKIVPALDSPDGKRGISGLKVVLAPTEIKDGKGTTRDAFDEKRTVAVKTYTPGQQYVRNLEAPVRAVFEQRVEQVAVMARVYGAADVLRADKPAEKERAEDAVRNAATLKHVLDAGGKMRLESDDDWRGFVLQKFKDMTTGAGSVDKATALGSVIKLLYDYLGAFTIHARFTDIYDKGDFKDAYFNHPFPHTLAGQLVHDCGVYALRVAYILSLVRNELGLKFRFVRMPAHVGLVITGDSLPLYVAQNDHFNEYTWDKIQELYAAWDARNEEERKAAGTPAKTGPKPAAIADEQFLAEIAAVHFIEGPLDMPVSLSEVPKPGKTAAATQQALWAEYKKVASKDVFGPATDDKKSPNYLFHNRYLAITERFREWHNASLVPFWNKEAVKSWTTFETALKTGDRAELTGAELKPLLETHLKEIDEGLKPAKESLSRIEAAERDIGKQLKEDPKLKAPGVRVARGGRLVITHSWDTYRARVADAIAAATAAPDDKLKVADIISTTLKPPFVPAPENSMSLLD